MKRLFLSDSVFNDVYNRNKLAFISQSLPLGTIIGCEVKLCCSGAKHRQINIEVISIKKLKSVYELTPQEIERAGYKDVVEASRKISKDFVSASMLYYISFKIVGIVTYEPLTSS